MALTVANSLEWHNRKPNEFIDQIVQNTRVLDGFTIIDGVKSKVAVPKYSASITYHSDLCSFDPQSSASIDDKEMAVDTFKWDFINCKDVLETEYRSMMLRKGQLNEQTMDDDFADWLFDYFRKLVQEKVVTVAGAEIVDEIENGVDAGSVLTPTITNSPEVKANVYASFEELYKGFSADLLSAVYGDADRDFRPVIYVGTAIMQAFQLARADKYTDSPQGLDNGVIGTYMGMEVRHFSSLPADTMIATPPRNLVMLTDEYGDTQSIQTEYDRKTNSRLIWGALGLRKARSVITEFMGEA